MEVRIYYEALEQGIHLIQDLIQRSNPNIAVKLVKKRQQSYSDKGFKVDYSKLLSKILIKKNPDIIVSIIINKIEYPIIVLEFSTAVYTKDHEQQRADNYLLPIHNNLIYIKLSPISKTSKEHGGDTKYNYIEPYSFCLKNYGELAFHFNWEVEKNNSSKIKKDNIYKSIAPKYEGLQQLFNIIFNINFTRNINNWKEILLGEIDNIEFFKQWKNKLKSYKDFEDIKNINSTRTQWEDYNADIKKSNVFTLKINRMGHAMDPERGMLIYYSSFYRKGVTIISKMIFSTNSNTWYKDTSSENTIKNYIRGKNSYYKSDLIFLFATGLNIHNDSRLISIVKNNPNNIVDITNFVTQNYHLFNTSFRTIIDHSDYLFLTDEKNKLYLTWKNSNFNYDLSLLKNISTIKGRETISEDDVTYITVHNVFKENKINVISVSYPGAQSDMPILPNKNAGRKQERVYIDVIGLKKKKLILQENKGKFSITNVRKDIDKISLFKTNFNYKEAVITFTKENTLNTDKTVIGVGFGESVRQDLSKVNLNKVDYFLIISKDLKSWKLYSNMDKADDIFNKKSGTIILPKTYKVVDL